MLNVEAKELSYLSSLFISLSRIFRCFATDIAVFCSDACKGIKAPKISKFFVTEILLIYSL